MHTLTAEDLMYEPQRLFDDAAKGELALVTMAGEPLLFSVPLGRNPESLAMRLELAAHLYDRDQISFGLAARIAGLSYSELIDEFGRRGIATIRLQAGELARELAAF